MKKTAVIMYAIICMTLLNGCQKKEVVPEEFIPVFAEKVSFLFKEDGWVYNINIVLTKKDGKGNTSESNLDYDSANVFLSGENLKYKRIEGLQVNIKDSDGKITQSVDAAIPSLFRNEELAEEANAIEEFLIPFAKQNQTISLADLNTLNTSFFKKEDILTLYNDAIAKKDVVWGDLQTQVSNCIQKPLLDNSILQLSYILDYGKIGVMNIEVIDINGEYMSDKVASGIATEEEVNAQSQIDQLEIDIASTQEYMMDFHIDFGDDLDFNNVLKVLLVDTFKDKR